MASIRLSPDVEEIARDLGQELGMPGLKPIIEAVFRTKWQEYRDRPLTSAVPVAAQPIAVVSTPTKAVQPINAAAELDALLDDVS